MSNRDLLILLVATALTFVISHAAILATNRMQYKMTAVYMIGLVVLWIAVAVIP